jgi:Cation transporter/ATPase, N-terminus
LQEVASRSRRMENAWAREVDDIAREFHNVDLHTGLSSHQVLLSLEKYGKNGNLPVPTPQDFVLCLVVVASFPRVPG